MRGEPPSVESTIELIDLRFRLLIMIEFFRKLFATDFMPHGYCIRRPEVIWLHEVSDLIIALAYFLIPLGLAYLVRKRRDLVFPWMFWLFSIFILSCGATHLLAVYVLWHPVYRLDGLVKGITALASLPTALLLIRLVPRALLLPSPEQLRQQNERLAHEITERRRAEDEIRRLNEELEARVQARTAELQRANADLSQFAYAASHDLQEPLRMVAIYAQMAERREADRLSSDGKTYLRYAADGARRMQTLVSDLLTYTEESAQEVERTDEADAEAALREAEANLAGLIHETEAAVLHEPLPAVAIQTSQLVRLFQNLLSNAMKYRRDGVAPRIAISAEKQGEYWRFTVRDNGRGISPDYHEQVFGLFKRLQRGEIPGTGLGLALCRRIVERHGGKIWVESSGEGHGSTFFFTLPAGGVRPLT